MTLLTIASSVWVQLFIAASFFFFSVQSQTESSASTASTTFNATLVCSMVENGTFLKDPTACNVWIQCVDDEPISGTCDSGLFYNRNTNECVASDSIKCYSSQPCATTTTTGFVADPYSCNGYYYCYNGKGTRGECSAGLNYNPGTQDCVRDFVCPTEPDPDSWCNIIPDGEFFSDLQTCQGYHMCNNDVLENGTCPSGYYFNAFESICDYKADVVCNVPEAHPNLPGEGICQSVGQFVSDNETCAGYYYCQAAATGDYVLIWGQCTSGRFFDPTNGGECVDRRQIACNYNRCEGMGVNNIQLANAPDDGCLGYLICQDGEEIGSGLCPNDEEYYDEVAQRCTTSVVTYPACLVAATTTTTTATTTTITSTSTTTTSTSTTTTSTSTTASKTSGETTTNQEENTTEEESNSVES